MLAKPESFSPPDEGCCWQGVPMRFLAGRGAVAERLVRGAAVAERHRENVAGQGAGAERLARAQ